MAEEIFKKFADQFGLPLIINYDIYPDERQIDFGQDLETLVSSSGRVTTRCRVDIKASKSYAKWLMVEGHKFWSDAYIFIKINLPDGLLESLLEGNCSVSISGEVSGFAYYFDLLDPKTKAPWFLYEQGDKFIDPASIKDIPKGIIKTPKDLKDWLVEKSKNNELNFLNVNQLSPTNYGLPADWLRKSEEEWRSFFNWIKRSSHSEDDQIIIRRFN